MNEAQKNYFYSKHFTLKGQMYFPNILVPKANDRGVLKYNTCFAWPANDAAQQARVQEVEAFLAAAKQQFFASIPDQYFGNPLKKFNTYQRQDGKPNHEFLNNKFWFNASASEKFKPTVVFQDHRELDPLGDAAQVWSGRNCLLNFSFYCYDVNGKNGIATNIRSIMLLEGGEKVEGGAGTVNVQEAFGSFSADMGAAPVAPAAPVQQQPAYQPPVQPAYQPPVQPMAAPVQQPAYQPPVQPVAAPVEGQWVPGQPVQKPLQS